MAYIGVPQPSRAITSADIAQGAVTLNDISFTDVPANMDISGTIDKHTMRLAEGVTVTGDITISDNLILSKISDDGVGITLTNDSSTRTITGSGSIEASTLAQTPNASLTGMTGALGSGVTGTIGSGVAFPVGHILQVKYMAYEGSINISSGAWGLLLSTYYLTIVKKAGTNIFLQWSTQTSSSNASVSTYISKSKIERSTATNFGTSLTAIPAGPAGYTNASSTEKPAGSVGFNDLAQYNYTGNYGHTTIDETITSSAGTYYYRVQCYALAGVISLNQDGGIGTLTAMEIVA
jgi:hypothetical protein